MKSIEKISYYNFFLSDVFRNQFLNELFKRFVTIWMDWKKVETFLLIAFHFNKIYFYWRIVCEVNRKLQSKQRIWIIKRILGLILKLVKNFGSFITSIQWLHSYHHFWQILIYLNTSQVLLYKVYSRQWSKKRLILLLH